MRKILGILLTVCLLCGMMIITTAGAESIMGENGLATFTYDARGVSYGDTMTVRYSVPEQCTNTMLMVSWDILYDEDDTGSSMEKEEMPYGNSGTLSYTLNRKDAYKVRLWVSVEDYATYEQIDYCDIVFPVTNAVPVQKPACTITMDQAAVNTGESFSAKYKLSGIPDGWSLGNIYWDARGRVGGSLQYYTGDLVEFGWYEGELGPVLLPKAYDGTTDYSAASFALKVTIHEDATGNEIGWSFDGPEIPANGAVLPNPDPEPEPEPDPVGDPDPEAKAKVNAFVGRCYELIMGREAEEGGLNYWSGMLTDGKATASEIINEFSKSDEFVNRKLEAGAKVDILYKTMLDREADAGGREFWVGQLESGMSEAGFINGFCASDEFKNICEGFGIEPGTVQADEPQQPAGEGIEGFVRRCYQQVMQRAADQGGVDFWVGEMTRGMNPRDVANNFVFSEEMEKQNLSDDEFIKTLYRLYMGREYDEGGLAYWKQLMAEGKTRADVNAGFAGSPEFAEIVAGFGLAGE